MEAAATAVEAGAAAFEEAVAAAHADAALKEVFTMQYCSSLYSTPAVLFI